MVKIKTAQELKEEEANKFMENARKQHAQMLKKAVEMEEKNSINLEKCMLNF
ncbi:MAG: hypothetical protein NTW78_01980 [Campylobacterales bacterium]|nr:hypothetical protein [Campylobacterales bacterium]